MKIKFREDRVIQDEHVGTENETSYKAGQVVELNDRSANHWIIRGVAEEVAEDAPVTPDEPAPEPRSVGFGRYKLSNGKIVKGKQNAIAAEAAIGD